jgi:hypothetical protein
VGVELQLHALLTSSLDEVSGQLHAPAALLPGKKPQVPIGWAPEPVRTRRGLCHDWTVLDICSSDENSVVRVGDMINAHKVLAGKPEGERPLGRRRSRWEGNIGRDLTELGWEGVDWIHLARDRYQWRDLVNMVMNL